MCVVCFDTIHRGKALVLSDQRLTSTLFSTDVNTVPDPRVLAEMQSHS